MENKVRGLPSLSGTPSDVTWAESIRNEQLGHVQFYLNSGDNPDKQTRESNNHFYGNISVSALDKADSRFPDALEILRSKNQAIFWIDNRELLIGAMLLEIANTLGVPGSTPGQIQLKLAAQGRATVRPENPITETIAEIRFTETTIKLSFPERRDDFREIVEIQNGFTWRDDWWQRDLSVLTGAARDRAAEIGNKLLTEGFIIRLYDKVARRAAVTGKFEAEHKRWIVGLNNNNKFGILWGEENRLFYAARKLPGSRWSKPYVVVCGEHYEEVLNFAELNGFRLSNEALEVAKQAKAIKENERR